MQKLQDKFFRFSCLQNRAFDVRIVHGRHSVGNGGGDGQTVIRQHTPNTRRKSLNIGAISKTLPFVVLDNKKQTAEKRSAKRFVKLLFLKKLVRQKVLRKVLQKEFPERGEPCSFSIRH